MIRDAYKLGAGQDCAGNVVAMTGLSYVQMMQGCGNLIDGETLKLSDIDLGKAAVKAADK